MSADLEAQRLEELRQRLEQQLDRLVQNQAEAIVAEAIHPHASGRVMYKRSWWDARSRTETIIPVGQPVRVVARYGLTL